LLFAHAVVPVNVSTEHGAHCGKGNMLRINAFALFTVEIGNFMMDIMRRRNPSVVVPHSVQSGLLGVLDHRLASAAQEFSDIIGWERAAADCSISIGSQSKSPALKRQTTMRFLLYS
jgi:hypothetical protein